MVLYHYTAREYLDAILREGLTKGEIPFGPRAEDCGNAVWFTTSPDSAGHGLTGARVLTVEECAFMGVPFGMKFPDKRAVRITVKMPKSKLKHWPSYGKKRMKPAYYAALSEGGGGEHRAKTWYISFRPIAPDQFEKIEVWNDSVWETVSRPPLGRR